MASDGNQIVREGVSAGLIGATAIAAWFGLLDLIAGSVLATPIMLGSSLATLFQSGAEPSRAAAFLLYTVFHFAMFIGIGLVFAWVVKAAEKSPAVLIGFIGLFVAFEVGWVGWTSVLSQGFGELAWGQVFIANLIGAVSMAWYMLRQHPELPSRVNRVLAGAE